MKNQGLLIKILMFVLAITAVFYFNAFASELTPEQTVCKFYNALKIKDYNRAYDCISETMKDGKDREKWAKDWKEMVDFASVEILGFSVSECKIDGDKATVRVSVKSKDMINKDGLTENETDHLVIENSVWKIDATEVDAPDI